MSSKELMLRVAELAFIEGKNNPSIAKELVDAGVLEKNSRVSERVGELVDEAGRWLLQRNARLSAIEAELRLNDSMSKELVSRFGLVAARVVPGGQVRSNLEYVALQKRFGQAAADYFEELYTLYEQAGKNLHVSLSGGQSILDAVSAFPDRRRELAEFYAAAFIGRGRRNLSQHVAAETSATMAWARSGRIAGKLHYGTVQPYERISDKERLKMSQEDLHYEAIKSLLQQKEELGRTPYVRALLDDIRENVTVAFAGLGIVAAEATDIDFGIEHVDRISMTHQLKTYGVDLKLLAEGEDGAAGEFAYCLFDRDGIWREDWRFFVTAGDGSRYPGIDFYRHLMEKRHGQVIVMAGARKEKALKIALDQRMLNVLITDEDTGRWLLKQPI